MSDGKKRLISAEDLYNFELVPESQISPDGEKVIYVVQRVEKKTEKKYTNLFMVSTKGDQPSQFTYGNHADFHPRWRPDGKEIAFLSNRGNLEKSPQIYLIPVNGGEARPLTQIEGSIITFTWSPDGRKLLCSIVKTDPEELEREKDETKKKLGVVYRQIDRLFYKLDGVGYLPKERNHIWVIDVNTGKGKQLTDHAVYDEVDPCWSPDGKSIVFLSNRSADPDNMPHEVDLYVMPAGGGEFRKIDTPRGSKSLPGFSPDGKWIAYYGAEDKDMMYKNTSLWIVPADGSKAPTNLTEAFDYHVSASTINDLGHGDLTQPVWSNDSQRIYFPVDYHGSTILKSIKVGGSDLKTEIDEGGALCRFGFDSVQKRICYFYGDLDDPGQIFVQDSATKKTKKLTKINRKFLDKIDLGETEEIWYKGPDHNDLQGWILKPPDFDPNKKYPSILYIHGGPMTQYGKFFFHEFYYLASKGYIVYYTNPRGGRGYGEEHTKAIHNHWGEPDYADLMAWTDVVSTKPYIDTKRMGVVGGSYGGYMTGWIIGHTQRFQAAIVQRCLSNFVSFYGSSDMNWGFQSEIENIPPYEDVMKSWNVSPMAYIKNARTPTMVMHNENDLRTPIEQGEQVFVALKRIGVETEMVRFPDEPHGLSRIGRTDRRIARLNHILRWFDKYLKS
jgi:dipeptidyl aminopeptidase/acylaminoacyl peptidase